MTISIVLYGRNDSYGYNLHKRAALSLNCMAEVLTDSLDEILFVDYNTPNDFPTFPEAIQDTLTKRARDLLRIFRVRPSIHQRFKAKTHLVALEPIARNVAVRRSRSANRWILSTNTDMVFVPRSADSLSKIAQGLAPGFYHTPRIEIPEVLWESLDRHAPTSVITTVRQWGSALHLNEIILGAEFILYDGPGDFQLLLRDDLFANHGFNEEMLLGWHVDSNMAKRMYLKYGAVGDLGADVYGYHCDHTRQVTPAHSHTRLQNDWRRFCHEVDRPDVPEQAATWGCVSDAIEEVRLPANPASIYVQALQAAVGPPMSEPQVNKYTLETYNKTDYDPRHMVPFLSDMLASMPRGCNIAWYGAGIEMLSRFATVWDRLGFTGKIFVTPELVRQNGLAPAIAVDSPSAGLNKADAFVFDFGGLSGARGQRDRNKELSHQLLQLFLQTVRAERRRLSAGLPSRRVIALNAINNHFERLVAGYIAAAATPCATHMRHGFVLPVKTRDEWLPFLHVGQAGVRSGDRITSDLRHLGVLAYGPYKYLDPGRYRLCIKFECVPDNSQHGGDDPCLVVVVHAGAETFGSYLLRHVDLRKLDHQFDFTAPQTAADLLEGIETRITLLGRVALSIISLSVESRNGSSSEIDSSNTVCTPAFALKIPDWLPYLSLGPLGRTTDVGTMAQSGSSDFVVFGPYWPLPAGYYALVIKFEPEGETQGITALVKADVMSGEEQLVRANFRLNPQDGAATIRLPFEITGSSPEWRQIETRIWSSGQERFRIRSLSVNALEQQSERDLLPFLLIGDAGQRVPTGFSNVADRKGIVAYSPCMRVPPGAYRITFAVEAGEKCHGYEVSQAGAFVLVKYETEVLEASEVTLTKGPTTDQEIVIEVPSPQDNDSGLEFFFQVVRGTDLRLRKLSIEPIVATVHSRLPAVLSLREWLPFLQKGKSAHAVESGVEVGEGVEEFALYGPFWNLPAGRYEMRAVVVPNPLGKDHDTFVTAQITGRQGADVFAESKLYLAHYKPTTAGAPIEFRLPFELSQDLPRPARTIETRFFTPGGSTFRILSLTVVARGENSERNWFPYLMADDCGIHTGVEIRSVRGGVGYVAGSPPMAIVAGRYKLLLDLSTESKSRDHTALSFELWCGSELFAITSPSINELEFDVPDEFSEKAIALRIRTLAEAEFSISSLVVDRVSGNVDPDWRPRLARAQFQNRMTQLRLQVRQGDVAALAKLSRSAAKSMIRRMRSK